MKILLDECVTKRLKKYIEEFEVFTVRELELSGIKNGKLMTYCVENKFDILYRLYSVISPIGIYQIPSHKTVAQ